mgnify:CR=1 FL=1
MTKHFFGASIGLGLGGVEMRDAAVEHMMNETLIALDAEAAEADVGDLDSRPSEQHPSANAGSTRLDSG